MSLIEGNIISPPAHNLLTVTLSLNLRVEIPRQQEEVLVGGGGGGDDGGGGGGRGSSDSSSGREDSIGDKPIFTAPSARHPTL
ncbi:hypothetical protein E2C01_016419 [Portunus trituberculatus]|uniref:Uncharacterized protein n=1 Tax=Portunus trituberculatus TaxID=210409 RepID=A0A5B7DQ76_PORTR|nr:hypothetical protein [Portunus trituberculatus]